MTFKFTENKVIDLKAARGIIIAPVLIPEDVTIEIPAEPYKQLRVFVYQDEYDKKQGVFKPMEIPGILIEMSVVGTAVKLTLNLDKLAAVKAYVKIETENWSVTGVIEP